MNRLAFTIGFIILILTIGCDSKQEFVKSVKTELAHNNIESFKKAESISTERFKSNPDEYEANYYLGLSKFLLGDAVSAKMAFDRANKINKQLTISPTTEIEMMAFNNIDYWRIYRNFDINELNKVIKPLILRTLVIPSDPDGWYFLGKFSELTLPESNDTDFNRVAGFVDYFDSKPSLENKTDPRSEALKFVNYCYENAYNLSPETIHYRISMINLKHSKFVDEDKEYKFLEEWLAGPLPELSNEDSKLVRLLLLLELTGKGIDYTASYKVARAARVLSLIDKILNDRTLKPSKSCLTFINKLRNSYQTVAVAYKQEMQLDYEAFITKRRNEWNDRQEQLSGTEDQMILNGIARDSGISSSQLITISRTHYGFANVLRNIIAGRKMKINMSRTVGRPLPNEDGDLIRLLITSANVP